MPFVEITDSGVQWSELVTMQVHPAADLFPMASEAEIQQLAADIKLHGLHRPIALTPDGFLLEGRGRWSAAKRVGIRPVTFVVTENPWMYVLNRNAAALAKMTPNERVMLAGRIPRPSTTPEGTPAPTTAEIKKVLGVSRQVHAQAVIVHERGIKALHQLVRDGLIPIYTASRLARERNAAEQEDIVNRIRRGESPRIAYPLSAESRRRRGIPVVPEPKSAPVNRAAIERILEYGEAMQLVVDRCDGLDPTITSDEAGKLLAKLRKTIKAYRQIAAHLSDRKDSPDS